ncbi:MAG: P-II family nitrogen regulator [Clostridia bacterium]|nr:P-II family nitrogen regulator [Clostridia bacterium]
MQKMYLFLTITNREDEKEFEEFFKLKEIPIVYSTPCHGTAKKHILDLFGVEESLKTAHYSVVTENKKNELLKGLTKEMAIDLPNRGIAVSIPLTSIAGKRALEAFADRHQNDETENEVKDMTQCQTELIIAICENGYTEKVMEAARQAGAAGGTVVHAKGTGAKYAKFFGLTLADEKEMIYIVSSSENKKNIMSAIVDGAGPHTDAHTIVFSLPVSDTAGLKIFEK